MEAAFRQVVAPQPPGRPWHCTHATVPVQFESVVTVSGLLDVAAVEGPTEARALDGTLLCFVRDAASGSVTVRTSGDPTIAVLAPVSAADLSHAGGDGQPAVDLPVCTGRVHMVVEVRREEAWGEARGGCGGSGARLGRRGAAASGAAAAVDGGAVRTEAWPHAQGHRAASVLRGRSLQDADFGPDDLPEVILSGSPTQAPPGTGGGTGLNEIPPPAPNTTGISGVTPAPQPEPEPQPAATAVDPANTPGEAAGEEDTELLQAIQQVNAPPLTERFGQEVTGPEQAPAQAPVDSADGGDGGDSRMDSVVQIIIGIAAGLVLFALLAVCFIWYRRTQRNRKAQFAVAKRPDGYEYSHAYAPPAGAPPQPPPPPPEAHLSVVRPPLLTLVALHVCAPGRLCVRLCK